MNYEKSVVKITVQRIVIDLNHPLNLFDNESVSGSGVFIEKGLILTCYHVIKDALEILVHVYKNELDKSKIKAKVKHIFPDDDLAIIRLEDDDVIYQLLDYDIITHNHNNVEVNTVGYPLGSDTLKVNRGVIAGFQDSLIQTDSPLNPGNSGGPLILNNKIIGINQSKHVDANNTGYVVPIFRFLIYWKLRRNELKMVNKKPSLLMNIQYMNQGYDKFNFKTKIKNGVMVTEIGKASPIKNIEQYDILLKINGNRISYNGYIKFPFYPQKICIEDLNLWFSVGDKINLTYYSVKNDKYLDEEITVTDNETQLVDYYYENKNKYYYENSGLIFSVFTNYHLSNIGDLGLNKIQKIKIVNRYLTTNHLFTVYLSDLDYAKLKFTEYPIGDIITEINDVEINNYDIFIKIINQPIKKFKTIDNNIFFI